MKGREAAQRLGILTHRAAHVSRVETLYSFEKSRGTVRLLSRCDGGG